MLSLLNRPASAAEPAIYQAGALLDAFGLTLTLPEALAQDAAGHAFEPFQLSPERDLAEQFALLIRPEPLAGAEALIAANRQRIDAQAEQQIERALASVRQAPRSFIQDLRDTIRDRYEQLAAQLAQADDAYRRLQERLHAWQGRQREPGQGLGATLWQWVFGGEDRLSLPDAIALWNQREVLATQRASLIAAIGIFTHQIERLRTLLAQLDERLAETRIARAALQRAYEQARQAATAYDPWTLRVTPAAAVEALLDRADPAELLAELLGRMAAADGAALADVARALADAAATQALAPLTIANLIALEAQNGDPEAPDPLVPIGQALLDIAQQPTWQLARGARPRSETLQITPDGSPLYSLEGLGGAAYGGETLCLGFVQVQLGVAKDDLALLRDDDEAFRAALRQRNLFVLEELAQGWVPEDEAEPKTNGHGPLPGPEVEVRP